VKTPAESAQVIRDVLAGKSGPHRDMVVLNAAAALAVAGKANDIADGVPVAQHAIDTGAARDALERLVQASNS
jgi:anthranilate phosphoribosyltransferase